MKPHSLRKSLWLVNLALGAAVIGVGAWFVLKVRPAVASVTNRKANTRPVEWEKVRKEYEGQRLSGLKWKPTAPVTEADIRKVILRKDYEQKKPRHWPFSGPLPPEDRAEEGPVNTGPPPPTGLETLGSISSLIYIPPKDSVILFAFSGKSLAFSVGDFVRKSEDDPARFKITDVKELRPKVYEVEYEIWDAGAKEAAGTAKMTYDQSDAADEYPSFLQPVGARKPAAGKPEGADPQGTGEAAGKPGPDAGGKPPAKGEGPAWVKGGEKGTGPEVVDVAGAAEDITLQDLKPEIEYNPRNRNQRAIKFDNNTYKYFRGKKAKSVAETVKTRVAKDKNGRVIGLRITGFGKEAPADVFDVRRGDILVSINGQKISTRADAIRLAEKLNPDKLVTVVIDRNGKLITYRVDPRDPKLRREARYFENLK